MQDQLKTFFIFVKEDGQSKQIYWFFKADNFLSVSLKTFPVACQLPSTLISHYCHITPLRIRWLYHSFTNSLTVSLLYEFVDCIIPLRIRWLYHSFTNSLTVSLTNSLTVSFLYEFFDCITPLRIRWLYHSFANSLTVSLLCKFVVCASLLGICGLHTLHWRMAVLIISFW